MEDRSSGLIAYLPTPQREGNLMGALLSSLLPLVVLGGLIFLVLRGFSALAEGDSDEPLDVTEVAKSAAMHVGLFLALLACAVAAINVLQAFVQESSPLAGSNSDLARGLALSIVGVPAYLLLYRGVARRYRERAAQGDRRPHRGWSAYLISALTTTLLATLISVVQITRRITDDGRDFEPSELMQLIVWAGLWVAHWFVFRPRFGVRYEGHLAIGTIVGFSWLFSGIAALVYRVLAIAYDSAFNASLANTFDVAVWIVVALAGAGVWGWHWFAHFNLEHAQSDDEGEGVTSRSPLWFFTVVVAGALPGLIAVLVASTAMASGLLIWFLGSTDKEAAVYFEPAPVLLAVLFVGVLGWVYHRWQIVKLELTERNESLRFYDYAVVTVGLVGVVGAMSTLVSLLIDTAASGEYLVDRADRGNALMIVLVVLAASGAIWWRHWGHVARHRSLQPREESDSIWRKLYLVSGFGVGGLVLSISTVSGLFVFLRDLLDNQLGRSTIHDLTAPAGWAIGVAGAVWYHLRIWQDDRAVLAEHSPPTPSPFASPASFSPPSHLPGVAVAKPQGHEESSVDANSLIEYIRTSVIGADVTVAGPFGTKPMVYADYTASGRALSFIEDFMSSAVLPLYANTHTESSGTGLQTSRFREDARDIIADCVGADRDHAVLFTGSGATAAIDKLIRALGIRIPSTLEDHYQLSQHVTERPVVFIGPYEHHSNELPWRESLAEVVTIGEDANGHVDLVQLEHELERYDDRSMLIGSFSAASNVTGIITDTQAVSSLLHQYGAKAFWDFAAAAPYLPIHMGSPAEGDGYLDAIFVSPHKFIGGPGTPGLLVARRDLFSNRVPTVPGGGTVAYVSAEHHEFLEDIEHREEGGTPDILGSIRAGLVFQLKQSVGAKTIQQHERRLFRRAITAWSGEPTIEILGNTDADRLSVLSFVIRSKDGADGSPRYLHHNFVVAILNDLFGIQSRGGCSCAGPYGHRLLGIDLDHSLEFEGEINRGCEGIKPGWVRVNLNYFIDDEQLDYIIEAVRLVARSGHLLLPLYRFEPDSGLWIHRQPVSDPPMSLHEISYLTSGMSYRPPSRVKDRTLAEHLSWAQDLLAELERSPQRGLPDPATNDDFEHLRWFPYPSESGVR